MAKVRIYRILQPNATIYFKPSGPGSSESAKNKWIKILILIDFNKCNMNIFNKIDFLPSYV